MPAPSDPAGPTSGASRSLTSLAETSPPVALRTPWMTVIRTLLRPKAGALPPSVSTGGVPKTRLPNLRAAPGARMHCSYRGYRSVIVPGFSQSKLRETEPRYQTQVALWQ